MATRRGMTLILVAFLADNFWCVKEILSFIYKHLSIKVANISAVKGKKLISSLKNTLLNKPISNSYLLTFNNFAARKIYI